MACRPKSSPAPRWWPRRFRRRSTPRRRGCSSALHRELLAPPGGHPSFEVVDPLLAQRRRHLGRDRAALADLADEDDVILLNCLRRAADDPSERNVPRAGNVVPGVLPIFAHVHKGRLAPVGHLLRLPRAESRKCFAMLLSRSRETRLTPSTSPARS